MVECAIIDIGLTSVPHDGIGRDLSDISQANEKSSEALPVVVVVEGPARGA